LPLGDTILFTPVVMLNVLGQDTNLMKQENMGKNKLHLYGKTEAKVDRKMGHINVLRESVDKCLIEVEKLLNFNN
jgi:5-(carboxyamino)imidazole ribonucleotide synthase